MIYVFEDGRMVFKEELLPKVSKPTWVTVEKLPEVEIPEGKYVVYLADLSANKVKVEFRGEIVAEVIEDNESSLDDVNELIV